MSASGAAAAGLRPLGTAERARGAARFFRTGPGEYGAGGRFLGVTLPQVRAVVRRHGGLALDDALDDALALLQSAWHEERFAALRLMVAAHDRAEHDTAQRAILDAYLAHTRDVNNWDLVDTSAASIVGPRVGAHDLALLDRLAASDARWERRIAIVATLRHLRRGELRPTTETILRRHLARLPRTAHRSASELVPEAERRRRLAGDPPHAR